MHSVIETVENGHPTSVAVQSVWLKNGKLYWPPGKNLDRKTPSVPQENWLEYDYKLLKSSIETFEEAIEYEKMYSNHRDSGSFRECQEQKKMKRQHPVNLAEHSKSDLIDVNEMVRKINSTADLLSSKDSHANKYHEKCVTSTLVHPTARSTSHRLSPVKKPVAKGLITSVKRKAEPVKENHQTAKKAKKGLPFQNNYLKSGISKSKDRVVSNGTKPKHPRYDNFLKSGKRLEIPSKAKAKNNVATATVTKAQYLKQTGKTSEIDLDGENGVAAIENIGGTSTPYDIEENRYQSSNSANNVEGLSDFLNARRGSVERFTYSGHTELNGDFQTNSALVQDSPVRAAAKTLPQSDMSFEERVLKELSDLRKTQESFETRIEKRIENFFNNHSRMKGNGQSQMRGSTQSRMQGAFRSRMEDNGQSLMQSGHYGGIRNGTRQTRYREPVSPERYIDDFEEFEELDKKFPVNDEEIAEELEFTVRRDLDFKLLLKSRLHELGGNEYKKCIRLRMQYLFTNPALELYTWWGTEDKSPFKNLRRLNNLILASVREQCPNTRADEYKDYVQTWLKHARSRQRKVTYTYPAGKNLGENREDRYDEDDDDDDNDENNN